MFSGTVHNTRPDIAEAILYNIKDEVAWKSLDIFLLTQMQWLSFVVSFVGLRSQAINQSNLSATVMNNV